MVAADIFVTETRTDMVRILELIEQAQVVQDNFPGIFGDDAAKLYPFKVKLA